MATATAMTYKGTFHGRAEEVSRVRREVAGYLADCPASDELVLIADELAANCILFCLLSSCVAIAAIGGQADLRPALPDYLFLAAACCGICEAGHPPSSADQLRHGCHRTRRPRKEILHTRSRGAFFRVRCELSPGSVRIEVEDMGGPWRKRREDDRPHGLDIVEALTGPDGWGTDRTSDDARVVWARLSWEAGRRPCAGHPVR